MRMNILTLKASFWNDTWRNMVSLMKDQLETRVKVIGCKKNSFCVVVDPENEFFIRS